MNSISITKLFIASVLAACLALVVFALQYVISGDVSGYVYSLLALFVAESVLIGSHFWVRNILRESDFQKIIFYLVRVELGISAVALIPLVFSWFDLSKTVVVVVILQLIHGTLYLCNMFLCDEKPGHKNLTEEEIISVSRRSPIDPSAQDSDE